MEKFKDKIECFICINHLMESHLQWLLKDKTPQLDNFTKKNYCQYGKNKRDSIRDVGLDNLNTLQRVHILVTVTFKKPKCC